MWKWMIMILGHLHATKTLSFALHSAGFLSPCSVYTYILKRLSNNHFNFNNLFYINTYTTADSTPTWLTKLKPVWLGPPETGPLGWEWELVCVFFLYICTLWTLRDIIRTKFLPLTECFYFEFVIHEDMLEPDAHTKWLLDLFMYLFHPIEVDYSYSSFSSPI